MLGITLPAETVRAATVVGAVLVQALVLYVGYGGLERAVGPGVERLIEGGS